MRFAKEKVLSIRAQLPRLGVRKLHGLLSHDPGVPPLGRDQLFTLLREEGLLVKRKRRYTKTTNSRHWMRKYPNRIKDLVVQRPEQLWAADITYITLRDRFMYLHLITDLYSKMIVGYKLSENLSASSSLEALQMALGNRKRCTEPLIHHSDRGLQYCSSGYTTMLGKNGIDISMTEEASPYENAVAERVNGILKDEFGLDDIFEDSKQAEKQVCETIILYNEKRPHLSNHMLTPLQMHNQCVLKPKTWKKKTTSTISNTCGS
jgi:transposase InsO family protein